MVKEAVAKCESKPRVWLGLRGGWVVPFSSGAVLHARKVPTRWLNCALLGHWRAPSGRPRCGRLPSLSLGSPRRSGGVAVVVARHFASLKRGSYESVIRGKTPKRVPRRFANPCSAALAPRLRHPDRLAHIAHPYPSREARQGGQGTDEGRGSRRSEKRSTARYSASCFSFRVKRRLTRPKDGPCLP